MEKPEKETKQKLKPEEMPENQDVLAQRLIRDWRKDGMTDEEILEWLRDT